MAKILVTGGTGTLGREVVLRLQMHDHQVRLFTHRSSGEVTQGIEVVQGDLRSGEGLREAVAGIDVIVHCASASSDAQVTDLGGTRMLLQAALDGNAPHIVYVSIVGVDAAAGGYYQVKHTVEQMIQHSGLPWTTVRATQYDPFLLQLIQSFGTDTLPEIPFPRGIRFQPIDVGEVADRLVTFVDRQSAGVLVEMGGPQVLTVERMIETYLQVRGRKARLRPETLASPQLDAFRADTHLCPERAEGKITWEQFLRRVYAQPPGFPVANHEVNVLFQKRIDVPDHPEITVHTIEFAPGAPGAPPHTHPGPIFGYIMEGEVLFQVHGQSPRIYKAGDVFFEPDGCLHLLANNPNPRRPARLLAVLIGRPGAPILTPVNLES
jgi:uncharacterized protein YbjT (DUF2867 family)/quercetin dioxygenase-like cupin family protein